MKWMAVLLVGCVFSTEPPSTHAQRSDDRFDYAAKRTATWSLTATTNVYRNRSVASALPTVASVECKGESRQVSFLMDSSGRISWLHITYLGEVGSGGDREQIALLGDRLWLYVDGERWQYANIPIHSSLFSNLDYPEPDRGDIVIADWRGYPAVRKSDDQPWQNLSRIYDRLIGAKRIEWGFKSRDWSVVDESIAENRLPDGWETKRYPVDTVGLRSAVSWCTQQIYSEAAYVLPDTLRKGMPSKVAH